MSGDCECGSDCDCSRRHSGTQMHSDHAAAYMTEGRKDDSSKLRYDLIPPYALEALAHVYTIGATKYGDDNYLHGMDWSRVGGALMRHYEAWREGEPEDQEDGQLHLASVAWCAFTLMVYDYYGIGNDDRALL